MSQDSLENVAYAGFGVVIIGVALEMIDVWFKWKKEQRNDSILVKDPAWMFWIEAASVFLVVVGLSVEFIGGLEASLKARATIASLISANTQLKQEMKQTTNSVAINHLNDDPINQRIFKVESEVFFMTKGWNFSLEPVAPSNPAITNSLPVVEPSFLDFPVRSNQLAIDSKIRVYLAYGRPESFQTGLPTMFLTRPFVQYSSPDGTNTLWKLNFSLNTVDFPRTNTAGSMHDWNLFEIEAGFLSPETEILKGNIHFEVNGMELPIEIPPQVVLSRESDWTNFLHKPKPGVWVFGQ